MSASRDHHRPPQEGRPKTGWVFFGFLALAAFYLMTEHRAHLLGLLPWLLLLACPLMHLFMHHGHHDGHHQGGTHRKDKDHV